MLLDEMGSDKEKNVRVEMLSEHIYCEHSSRGEAVLADDILTSDEFIVTLRSLSAADWTRIHSAAKYFAYVAGGNWKPEDLRQEAIIRAVDGERNCPIDVNVVSFLTGAMRSIVSASAKAAATQAKHLEMAGGGITPPVPAFDVGPEQNMIEEQSLREKRAQILDLFVADSIEKLLVEGIMEGLEGHELCELAEIDAEQLATKRKFIRRTISKAFPNGSNNEG